ncbi:MAG: hypothetical protein ACOCWM_03040, partial [Cyclobacteriaceae bacterium]
MTKYHPKTTISLDDWLNAGLTIDQYKNDKKRGYLETLGRAAFGKPVQIIWSSIVKESRKRAIIDAIGDPEHANAQRFRDTITHDDEAFAYFSEYTHPDGAPLSPEKLKTYYATACVLNAMINTYNMRIALRRRQAGSSTKNVLPVILEELTTVDKNKWPYKLPSSRRIRQKMRDYQKYGYECLIERYAGNQNRRKVD